MKRKVIIALYAFLAIDIAFMAYLTFIDGDLLHRTYSLPAGALRTAAREALDSNLTIGTVASYASSLAIFLGLYLNRCREVRL